MSSWAAATRLLAALGVGMALAIWLLPLLAGPQVQKLRLERDQALGKVELLEAEVVKLQEAERTRRLPCEVTRVRAEVEGPDERVGLEAGRRIQRELASEQIGRRIDGISFLILYSRYQGLIMEIDGVRYQLEVKALVIGPELTLYGNLALLERKGSGSSQPQPRKNGGAPER